ncbi:MAG: hypothetical protein BWK76_20035 [Desulfobulbaceae bacterium A2]|nr:MAG: hypothetical protein BWK76_20035 [Desulfobulbaceae bacterium A2]
MRRGFLVLCITLFSFVATGSCDLALARSNGRTSLAPKSKQQTSVKAKSSKQKGNAARQTIVKSAPKSKTKVTSPLLAKLSAKSAIVLDAQNGAPLMRLADEEPRQPASTIKVLTGLIALKSLHKDESVQVSRRASDMPRSKVDLVAGRHYQAHDLINAVLLASANDASVALAEKIAGSETDFARMMTMRAELWGAKNTVCKTANGLTAPGQQTTARDLAVIFRHAMRDPEFARRMGQISARTREGMTLKNHNKALWNIEGAVGGKTGYTVAAGKTYVGQFERNGAKIIVAVMGSADMWQDIGLLVEYGFQQHQLHSDQVQARTSGARDRTIN